ncbi:hypothetical protein BJY00DRAFT_52505 [Aspergillus carlsbadensis]|nr:hypothetical protein BJY00DRAFT_52505 [Aspergillus carlsbadensis]
MFATLRLLGFWRSGVAQVQVQVLVPVCLLPGGDILSKGSIRNPCHRACLCHRAYTCLLARARPFLCSLLAIISRIILFLFLPAKSHVPSTQLER